MDPVQKSPPPLCLPIPALAPETRGGCVLRVIADSTLADIDIRRVCQGDGLGETPGVCPRRSPIRVHCYRAPCLSPRCRRPTDFVSAARGHRSRPLLIQSNTTTAVYVSSPLPRSHLHQANRTSPLQTTSVDLAPGMRCCWKARHESIFRERESCIAPARLPLLGLTGQAPRRRFFFSTAPSKEI